MKNHSLKRPNKKQTNYRTPSSFIYISSRKGKVRKTKLSYVYRSRDKCKNK